MARVLYKAHASTSKAFDIVYVNWMDVNAKCGL